MHHSKLSVGLSKYQRGGKTVAVSWNWIWVKMTAVEMAWILLKM